MEVLVLNIQNTNNYFLRQVQKQVNVALTLRNWLIGFHIFEFEQNGLNRAEYGEKLFKNLALRLKAKGIKGFSFTNLHLYNQFYLAYPQIVQSLTEQFKNTDIVIVQTLSEQFLTQSKSQTPSDQLRKVDTNTLINRLSFSHFIELLKADTELKRAFYETETIKNNWSVRELQRAMNSMLYERTGLSKNKEAVIEKHINGSTLLPEDMFRNPYILEFLNIEEKAEYSESDLEDAILNQIQKFLIELGKGFCFEARQKRITFDNTHYRIDLVFYNRILKCNVLFDLKIGEFDHSDAGQMNMYINYFKDNEMTDGDNAPIGVILCANKNANLVKYATAGLSHKIFVNKYLINLPKEEDLKKIIEEEQLKFIFNET
ncbi:MAG: cytoplasmic protein [Bacteroidetes bacterium GWA2_31_9]|nr:MAG: cytoplasmic protein [Bacteroidetes bacterium GWA2_31_9]